MREASRKKAIEEETARVSDLKRLIEQANNDKPGTDYRLLRTIAEMDKSDLMPEITPIIISAETRLATDGRLQITSPILSALNNIEVGRVHLCPDCADVFYDRPNKKTCSVACGNRKHQRDFRNKPDNADKIAEWRNRAEEKRVGSQAPIRSRNNRNR
jgi:CGNR zinc finger